jgi:hypothetical protein
MFAGAELSGPTTPHASAVAVGWELSSVFAVGTFVSVTGTESMSAQGVMTASPMLRKRTNHMNEHFNKLTPAEAERLAILAEECGEIIQIVGKILRHGYESTHPNGGPPNREILTKEMGDYEAAVQRMWAAHDIDTDGIFYHCKQKEQSIKKYLHHQP